MSNSLGCRRHPHVLVSNSKNTKKWPSRGLLFIWNHADGFCMLKIHTDLILKELRFHYGFFLDNWKIQVTVNLRIHKGIKKDPENYQRKKNLRSQREVKHSGGKATLLFLSRKWMEWNEGPGKDMSGFTNQEQKYSEILRYSDFISHLITIKPFVRIV